MTVTIAPGANPLVRLCQIPFRQHGELHTCNRPAVADAREKRGAWAYFCLEHLESNATHNPALITNITTEPLELEWL